MRVLIIKFIYKTYNSKTCFANKYGFKKSRHNKEESYLDYYNLF